MEACRSEKTAKMNTLENFWLYGIIIIQALFKFVSIDSGSYIIVRHCFGGFYVI